MKHTYDMKHCIATEINGILTVETDPDDYSGEQYLIHALMEALRSPVNILSKKAAAAIDMTDSIDAAAKWLTECEQSHEPEDCPLCGVS